MIKPSSFISALTLVAFVQCNIIGAWASPVISPEPAISTEAPTQAPLLSTLYLGADPYSQALLRLQYDAEDKSLEWQLLNNGYVLSSQSHRLPENTQTVDNGLVFNGDQMVVAGKTTGQHWFIRALNSQGEYQWQRKGEGRIYDLAFSDDGQMLYAVGVSQKQPLLLAVNTMNGVIEFHADAETTFDDDSGGIYKQVVVTGDKEVVVARHWEDSGQLQYIKWEAVVDPDTGEDIWETASGFCRGCDRTNIKSVALKNDPEQEQFYSFASDGSQLEFSIKDAVNGASVATQWIPVEMGSGIWDGVLRVDRVNKLKESLNNDVNDLPSLVVKPDSKLQILSSGCRFLLNGQAFNDKSLSINSCEDFTGALHGRRLLQVSDTTDPSDAPNRDFPHPEGQAYRVVIEWIGGMIGVIGGLGLITGAVAFIWSCHQKYKSIVEETVTDEINRRKSEREAIKKGRSYKPLDYFQQYQSDRFIYPTGDIEQMTAGRKASTYSEDASIKKDERIKLTNENLIKEMRRAKVDQSVIYSQDELNKLLFSQIKISDYFKLLQVGNFEKVLAMIERDRTLVKEVDNHGNTALHYFSFMLGAPDDIKKLLSLGANCSDRNEDGFTSLQLAVSNGRHPRVVATLLDCQSRFSLEEVSYLFHTLATRERSVIIIRQGEIDVNAKNFEELLVRDLHIGLSFDSFDGKSKVRPKLKGARQSSSLSEEGLTLLHEAVISGNFGVVDLILNRKLIAIDSVDDYGNTPLHYSALHESSEDLYLLKLLLKHHPSTNQKNIYGATPLHLSVNRGREEIIQELLNLNDGSIDIENNQHLTPLHLIFKKNIKDHIVSSALSKSKTKCNKDGESCLHIGATVIGTAHNIPLLAQQKNLRETLNQKTRDGKAPIDIAMSCKNIDFVTQLIASGANPTAASIAMDRECGLGCFAFSLYLIAIDEEISVGRKEELIRNLRSSGVDINERIGEQKNALDLILEDDNASQISAAFLVREGLNIDKVDELGNSFLINAVMQQRPINIIKIIISLSSDINIQNNEGNSALHIASRNMNHEIKTLLISAGAKTETLNNDGLTPEQMAEVSTSKTQNSNHLQTTQAEIHPQPPQETTTTPAVPPDTPQMPKLELAVPLDPHQEPDAQNIPNHLSGSSHSSSMESMPPLVPLQLGQRSSESPMTSPEVISISEVSPSPLNPASEAHSPLGVSDSDLRREPEEHKPTTSPEQDLLPAQPSPVPALKSHISATGSETAPNTLDQSLPTHRALVQDVTHSIFIPELTLPEIVSAPEPEGITTESIPEQTETQQISPETTQPGQVAIPMEPANDIDEPEDTDTEKTSAL